MDTTTDTGELLKDAGHAVDGLGMVWVRYLRAPLAEVWDAISTSEGLQKWWLGGSPRYTIELRVGGIFQHHWRSTITGFEDRGYIDFRNEPSMMGGVMRMELIAEGEGTLFAFLDQGPPPAGPAAGWHAMVDRLETCTTGKHFDFGAPPDARGRYVAGSRLDRLMRFYESYLTQSARRLAWLRQAKAG